MKLRPRKRKLRREDTGEEFTVEEKVSFDCPFCGAPVTVGDKVGTENYSVMHGMPMCKKFEEEDVLVYLRNARVALVGRLPDDDEHPIPFPDSKDRKDN